MLDEWLYSFGCSLCCTNINQILLFEGDNWYYSEVGLLGLHNLLFVLYDTIQKDTHLGYNKYIVVNTNWQQN